MSSSLVLASDHTMTSLNLGEDLQTRNDHPHHRQTAAVRRSSSSGTTGTNASTRRKSSRANEGCKKKQPQRGMGVAQLERLRLQERWKKITQISPPCSTSTSSSSTTPQLLLPTATLDTSLFAPETKAQFPKFPGFGNGVVAAAGLLQQQQQQGFHGQGLVSADHHHDMLQGYLYGIGNMINNGNSKELSSTPKVNKCFTHDHCADCHKKKRTFTGENLMFNEINKYANSHPVAGCDFTGLNIGVKGDLEKKATLLQSGISSLGFRNTDPEVEVVAVQQKKGSSGSLGIPNNAVTEYEFFPGKGGYRSNGLSSSRNDQLLMMKKLMGKSSPESATVMGGGGGASSNCFAAFATTSTTTTTTSSSTTAPPTGGASVDASTSIDLSLRLSY